MYIANVTLNNEWQSLETLISAATEETFTFDSSKTYHITNNSDCACYLINQDTEPSTKLGCGMLLPPHCQADFKTGTATKLYGIVNTNPVELCVEVEG